MNGNSRYNNTIGNKLRDFFTQEGSELNNGFLDFNEISSEIRKQILIAKSIVKEKQDINLYMYDKFMPSRKRLKSASDEVELIEDSTNQDFYEYITNLARIVDIMNNIGHVYQNLGSIDLSRDFMFAKNVALLKLAKECLHNNESDEHDIVFGISQDNTRDINKNVFIIDLPGIGQVSWHTIDGIADVLKMYGVKEYPYEIVKGSEHTNAQLLNLDIDEDELDEHQKIVASNINEPELIRRKLNEFYQVNTKPSIPPIKDQIGEMTEGREKRENYRRNIFEIIYSLLPPRNKQDSVR